MAMLVFRWLLIVGLLLHIDTKLDRFHEEAVAGRNRILNVQLQTQTALNDHILKAVERWQQIRTDNPQLKVKQMDEQPRNFSAPEP